MDVLHRYTTDEFLQQIKQVSQTATRDFQSFCCNLTLPLNLFIRHVKQKNKTKNFEITAIVF